MLLAGRNLMEVVRRLEDRVFGVCFRLVLWVFDCIVFYNIILFQACILMLINLVCLLQDIGVRCLSIVSSRILGYKDLYCLC